MYKCEVKNVENCLCWTKCNLKISLAYRNSKVYLQWSKNDTIMYNRSRVLKLRCSFLHSICEKRRNLYKLVSPYENQSETRILLEHICFMCYICKQFLYHQLDIKDCFKMRKNLFLRLKYQLIWCSWINSYILFAVATGNPISGAECFVKQCERYFQAVEGIWQTFIRAGLWFTLGTGTISDVINVRQLHLWNENHY